MSAPSDVTAPGLHTPRKQAGLRRRLARNMAWVGSSQALITVMGLVSLALTARALGPAGLGVLAFIEAYFRTVSRLVHPEPWQALIHFGTTALERGDTQTFGRLVWLALLADMVGGVLSAALGVGLAFWVAQWMPVAQGYGDLLALAAAATLIAPRPTAMGLLRIYDRFDLLARLDMAIAVLRTGLIALAWAMDLGLAWFVGLLVVWTLADGILPLILALRMMRRQGHAIRRAPVRAVLREVPGLGRVFVNTNINVTLRQLRQRLDIIVLAAILPAAGLGLYQLARRIGDAGLRIGRPLTQILLPEFSRLAARGQYPTLMRLMLAGSIGLGGALLVLAVPLVLNMDRILPALFGPEFADAVGAVNVMAVAMAFYMAGMSLGPALISLGRDRAMTLISAATTTVFFAALWPAARLWGAEGAAGAHLLSNAIWLVASIVIARTTLRGLREARS